MAQSGRILQAPYLVLQLKAGGWCMYKQAAAHASLIWLARWTAWCQVDWCQVDWSGGLVPCMSYLFLSVVVHHQTEPVMTDNQCTDGWK